MQIFILMTLIALGAEAHFWNLFNHPWHQWRAPPSQVSPVNNDYYQNKFSRYPQQNYPEMNFNIDQSITNAEWICRNPNTGATLIIAPKAKDQTTGPSDFSFPNFVEKKNKHNLNQENTNIKPNNIKNNGGEGLIDIRLA
ncbi:hypothetical protein M0804_006385 [Polistes exclamans]|nr:hypothetical protein M0804_006385 [Polistes exclamans]